MTTLHTEKSASLRHGCSLFAGALASLLTQPLEVLKTNMIFLPNSKLRAMHHVIIQKGWIKYMNGCTIAAFRQAFGFTIYTTMIDLINCHIESAFPNHTNFYKFSTAAIVGKAVAILFQAPLTVLKTRLQRISCGTFQNQLGIFRKNPMKEISKGLSATLIRQIVYSVIHYNCYRYLKDQVLLKQYNLYSPFLASFTSGIVSICISQPFEVIRSKICCVEKKESFFYCFRNHFREFGWRGFFFGLGPRLLRKPINSGICWAIVESIKSL